MIPILFIAIKRIRGEHIARGPFSLGRWSLPVNVFAIVYGTFIIIWLPFPPGLPVDASNLNWSGPIMGLVILFAVSDWYLNGKRRFLLAADMEVYQ